MFRWCARLRGSTRQDIVMVTNRSRDLKFLKPFLNSTCTCSSPRLRDAPAAPRSAGEVAAVPAHRAEVEVRHRRGEVGARAAVCIFRDLTPCAPVFYAILVAAHLYFFAMRERERSANSRFSRDFSCFFAIVVIFAVFSRCSNGTLLNLLNLFKILFN